MYMILERNFSLVRQLKGC
jgi:hypothetical protein